MTKNMSRPGSKLTKFVVGFLKEKGLPTENLRFHSLPSDGSNRLFWRVCPSQPDTYLIAMENAPTNAFSKRENLAYLMIGRHLFKKGIPVPEIYGADLENGLFILEDFGNSSLQDTIFVKKSRVSLYEKVIEILFRLQIDGAEGFNTEWCCQTARYDQFVMHHFEADYFKDAFLYNYLGLKKDWPELQAPFDHLAGMASLADSHFFLHRDFQSRNIMVSKRRIGILDWQGGRLGPLAYDLASLLLDPYVELSAQEKDQIYQHYLLLLKKYQSRSVDPFKESFPYLAIQRNLQVLGAFSYLSKVQNKPYFEAYISPALKSLHLLLDELGDPKLLPLKNVLNALR